MKLVSSWTIPLLALGALSLPLPSAVAAEGLTLCVKKIGKTNVHGRDVYLSRTGHCRQPLYTAVDLSDVGSQNVGPQGPQGSQGLQGVPGVQGEPGFVNVTSCYKKSVSNHDSSSSSSSSTSSSSSSAPSAAGVRIGYDSVSVFCDDPTREFAIESGYSRDYYSPKIVSDEPLFSDSNGTTWTYPIGRRVTMSGWGDGSSAATSIPELVVTVACCSSGQEVPGVNPTPTVE